MVKIFVGNLNPSSKSVDLRKRFELYGKVNECDIVNNYAFVVCRLFSCDLFSIWKTKVTLKQQLPNYITLNSMASKSTLK